MKRINQIKIALKENKIVTGCMLTDIRNPIIGTVLDNTGLNFMIIDMEHGSFSFETVNNILISCRKLSIHPFVRVPELKRECIQKPLDGGALGILVPRVNSKEDVEKAIMFAKYTPLGNRGVSISRAHNDYKRGDVFKFTASANENIMVMAQIEDKKGVNNMDSIMSVPGLDLIFIGPSDLRHSYGPEYKENIEEIIFNIVKAGKKYKVATGIHHRDLTLIDRLVKEGLQLISINTEIGAMSNFFSSTVNELKLKLKSRNI